MIIFLMAGNNNLGDLRKHQLMSETMGKKSEEHLPQGWKRRKYGANWRTFCLAGNTQNIKCTGDNTGNILKKEAKKLFPKNNLFLHHYIDKVDYNKYPDHQFKEKLCNLLKGFRRTVQQQKVELGLSLDEGKDPLTFAGYHLLCRTFLLNNGTNNEFTFAHCFFQER